ncbi:MAG: transglycosylase domain-containing protein [Myxococcales bacterium]|nr:transglycosylase domain-containing protein [Myxococcales bacterium]
MRLPSRRALIIAGLAVVTFVVLAVVGVVIAYPRVGRWMIEHKVIPKVEAKLGRRIHAGAIDVSRGHAVLRDVTVRGPADGDAPLAHVDRIDVDFDFWSSLRADPVVGAVTIDGVTIEVRRDAAGVDNVRDLIDRLGLGGASDGGGGGHAGMGRLKPTRIDLTHGTARAVDDVTGVVTTVADFDAVWQRGGRAVVRARHARATTSFGPAASVTELVAVDDPTTGRRVEASGGELQLWKNMSLTGITGTVEPAEAGRLAISFDGGWGGVEGKLWTFAGWVDPATSTGVLDLDAERFTLDRLRPVLERSAVVDYQDAAIDARLHLDVSAAAISFAGGFHVHDLSINHPLLAEKPVHDLDADGDVTGSYDRAARTLTLSRGDFSSRGLPFQITGWVALPGGLRPDGTRRERRALDGRLIIPPKPCQEVLDAIPAELKPYLEGFQLTGTFKTDLRLAIDWADLQATVLDGSVGIMKCKAKKAPDDVMRLAEPFEHYVEVEQDQWVSFMVGPENPDFVPITEVSPYLLNSLMTTEDSSFYKHHGFITREFKSALIKNLEAGYFKYGASSITMQLVKNVLLYREKTLARKFQELFLTWFVETKFDKDRLFEIYVNVIEYGPGIYGIGPAAWHYFGKHPRDLNPVEAAFFSSILPSPKQRYDQYCKGTLHGWTEGKIERILGLMYKRGRLTETEYQDALATPLIFAKDPDETEAECMARRKKAIKNARPTNPMKK